jgi:hypothetical protein
MSFDDLFRKDRASDLHALSRREVRRVHDKLSYTQLCRPKIPPYDSNFCSTSVKLRLMRRNSYIWAVGAFLFATILSFHGRTNHTASLSKANVESLALCEILRIQFHGCTHALLPKPVSHEFRSSRIRRLADLIDVSSELLDGPIQRRPPPTFS